MTMKQQDENHHQKELKRLREKRRKWLGVKYHPNTLTYKRIIKFLRGEAEEEKRDMREKYKYNSYVF